MKRIKIALLVSLLVIFATVAVQADYPVKIMDDMGYLTELDEKPMRIVSLAPNTTEILFALGAGERVVGRTDYCNYPEEALDVPSVGGYSQPSLETIMSVEPDLVLTSFGTPGEVIDQLRQLDIKVVGYNPQTIDDVLNLIWEIGKVIDNRQEATALINDMKVRIQAVKDLVKGVEKPLVFWEVWHDPLYTAGPDTYINDLITIAGGRNMAADAKSGSWPVYSLEVLVARNPEVYIATKDQWAGPGNIDEREGYEQIKAVKNDRVYVLNADNVNRPGPRLVDGLEEVVRVIHPELFE